MTVKRVILMENNREDQEKPTELDRAVAEAGCPIGELFECFNQWLNVR